MKLLLLNGSPRGEGSNTKILFERFLEGFLENKDNSFSLSYLCKTSENDKHIVELRNAETILLGFPLYTDSMPGIVKYFIDSLEPFVGKMGKKKIGFMVQSGFIGSRHSSYVERYLKKLSARLGFEYLGTILKSGVEGIQIQPPSMTNKLFASFYKLGKRFGKDGVFDKGIAGKLGKPYELTPAAAVFVKILGMFGLLNYYWDMNLKKNGAYEKRFDAPYA